tara:strand:- start:4158 stop:4373 length:216 start_codon:yes stop_codon:yes gene_type:complete
VPNASNVFRVSIKLSPFERLEELESKLRTWAPRRFWASSKENFVRVLFSKKMFAQTVDFKFSLMAFLFWIC